MTPKVMTKEEAIRATIRHFVENEGLRFTAYFESAGAKIPCMVDKSWKVHEIIVDENQISFIASDGKGGTTMKFLVRAKEFLASLKKWFGDISEALTRSKEMILQAVVPPRFVFLGGVTEYTPKTT